VALRKGEMLSSLLLAGSDIVLVFERRSMITVAAQAGVHLAVRSTLASAGIETLLSE
jgi:hypothetical protein